MRDMWRRPEIREVFESAPPDQWFGAREQYVLNCFNEYLAHKYGNETRAISLANRFMRLVADGKYSGLDDLRLKSDLLEHMFISGDVGAP